MFLNGYSYPLTTHRFLQIYTAFFLERLIALLTILILQPRLG